MSVAGSANMVVAAVGVLVVAKNGMAVVAPAHSFGAVPLVAIVEDWSLRVRSTRRSLQWSAILVGGAVRLSLRLEAVSAKRNNNNDKRKGQLHKSPTKTNTLTGVQPAKTYWPATNGLTYTITTLR